MMNHPERVRALLIEAAHILTDAQAHANAWDRQNWGRPLDRVRWMLEDYAASIDDTPATDEADPAAMFTGGTDR